MKNYSIIFLGLLLLFVSSGCLRKTEEKKLEIFNWWTAPGEVDGLEAMFKIYSQRHPEDEIINTSIAGGAGKNASAVLAARMQEGNPPDSFQVHAGHELIRTWVFTGKIEPLTFILQDNNWLSSYPGELIDIVSYNDEVYSIPVNIHRSNVLWYNKKIFHDNNINPPVTIDDFFKTAVQLEDSGITPLALGDSEIWAATHLLENVLLGSLGPAVYNGLWDGKTAWDSDDVKNALRNFMYMLKYVNTDHSALSWDQAASYVVDGTCGMIIMGDWIEGYFTAKGLTPDKEYGWKPSPGTDGSFMMFSDSFGLPKEAPHREQAVQWLTVCASGTGQDAFNPLKGSIPARKDVNKNLYDTYLQSSMEDFVNNTIVHSVTHGAAAVEEWVMKINVIISTFITEQDVDKAAGRFAEEATAFIK